MALSRPTFIVWLISTILVGLVIAVTYGGVAAMIPVAGPVVASNTFLVLLLAYALLWAGTVLKGV
jgi:hypothetical protein